MAKSENFALTVLAKSKMASFANKLVNFPYAQIQKQIDYAASMPAKIRFDIFGQIMIQLIIFL